MNIKDLKSFDCETCPSNNNGEQRDCEDCIMDSYDIVRSCQELKELVIELSAHDIIVYQNEVKYVPSN